MYNPSRGGFCSYLVDSVFVNNKFIYVYSIKKMQFTKTKLCLQVFSH